jgi:hypothetical protein
MRARLPRLDATQARDVAHELHQPVTLRSDLGEPRGRSRRIRVEEAGALRQYGTTPIPSSTHTGSTSSMRRTAGGHSDCSAAIGWTAWAARSSSAVTSDSPR